MERRHKTTRTPSCGSTLLVCLSVTATQTSTDISPLQPNLRPPKQREARAVCADQRAFRRVSLVLFDNTNQMWSRGERKKRAKRPRTARGDARGSLGEVLWSRLHSATRPRAKSTRAFSCVRRGRGGLGSAAVS